MEIDRGFTIMLVKSMHQIARIEFRNAKFPYARGLCPLATPARGPTPWTPVLVTNFTAPRGEAILDPPQPQCNAWRQIYLRRPVLDAGGKTGVPGENLRKQVWTGTKCTYGAGTGNRTRVHWCIAPGKNRYATCLLPLR